MRRSTRCSRGSRMCFPRTRWWGCFTRRGRSWCGGLGKGGAGVLPIAVDLVGARRHAEVYRNDGVTRLAVAKRFEDAGVAAIIYTDIARDGLLKGLNLGRHDRACGRDLDSRGGVGRARL